MRQVLQTRERILDAAERLIAEHGLDGVSMRQIAADAPAQLALLHYHFGSKEDLYRAVWERRLGARPGVRSGLLASLDFNRPREEVLRELVGIFVHPPLAMAADPTLRAFIQIVARESADPKEGVRGVIREFLDNQALVLIQAFRRALPELSDADVAWGYQFMVSVVIGHMADTARTTRLSGGAAKSGDVATAAPRIVDFVYGGWKTLAELRGVANADQLSPRKLRKKRRRIGAPDGASSSRRKRAAKPV
jgi:AcrR family transcriptional regulator